MTSLLHGRSFLKDDDFSPMELAAVLDLAAALKAAKYAGREEPQLQGKNIALIFEKTSTRTRCAFEVAAYDQGAHVTVIDPSSSQLGHKESTKDTARVLGRMYDGIQYRGFAQATIDILGRFAGVPVWNGLTDKWHPTQALCDLLTINEHTVKPLGEVVLAYCGDARNNTANSLLVAGALMGIEVRMVAPRALWNDDEVVALASRIAKATGARIAQVEDTVAGVRGADFVYTDIWVSMGEASDVWDERIRLLTPYQVNADLLARTGNDDVKFMHCLPSYHDRQTKIGEEIYRRTGMSSLEVTDEVFESPRSIVFDQAENRLHTIKALMVATLAAAH